MKKIVITNYKDKIVLLGLYEDTPEMIFAYGNITNKLIPGAIVNARVSKVNQEIDSSFIRVSKKEEAYLGKAYKCETVLPVLYKKEATDKKKALYTDNLSIAGKYCVIYDKDSFVKSSAKLSKKLKEELKDEYSELANELGIGILFRSKVDKINITDRAIREEIISIANKLKEIKEKSSTRSEYTILYSPVTQIIKDCVSFIGDEDQTEIVTDIKDVYELIDDNMVNGGIATDLVSLRFYEDSMLPLGKVYAIEHIISNVTSRIVNVKDGASLYIDHTEALVAIDINSARYKLKKSDTEDYALLLNKRAFKEVYRQIVLRNLSGIIMVDFVNMKNKDDYDELSEYIRNISKKDKAKLKFMGFTRLGLGEFSRQKTRGTFIEQLR